MNEHDQKRTERLFDAIGGIDDRLIQDAMSPKKARERIAAQKRMRISVAAVACLFCLVVGAVLRLPDLGGRVNSNSPSDGDEQSTNAPSTTHEKPDHSSPSADVIPSSLENTLSISTDSSTVIRLSSDKLGLLDSTPKLIWRFDGDEHYNVVKIARTDDLGVITGELGRPSAELSAEDSERVGVKMWISYGDGRIVSPYLKQSPGNTGMGALFDYNAEVEPSAKLTESIYELIN